MDAQLIIQMKGNKTGILNCKVSNLYFDVVSKSPRLFYFDRPTLEMKISDLKNSHLIIHIGPIAKIQKTMPLKKLFITILEKKSLIVLLKGIMHVYLHMDRLEVEKLLL